MTWGRISRFKIWEEDFGISKPVGNEKVLEAMVVQANAIEVKLA